MRYWCKNCESELKTGIEAYWIVCPACKNGYMNLIPEFETPEQYKERTGKDWPDNAPVWWKVCDEENCPSEGHWHRGLFKEMRDIFYLSEIYPYIILCFQSPNPPPDDWRPE